MDTTTIITDSNPSLTLPGTPASELLIDPLIPPYKSIVTFVQDLDTLLSGGVRLGQITEISGCSGIGKTQLILQLLLDVQIPVDLGGCEGEAIFIDTEGSFYPNRIFQMSKSVSNHLLRIFSKRKELLQQRPELDTLLHSQYTPEGFLSRIYVFRARDLEEQNKAIQLLPLFLDSHPKIKLIGIDSIAFHYRYGTWSLQDVTLRNKQLAMVANKLQSIAYQYNVAVVISNQLTTKFLNESGGYTSSSGGKDSMNISRLVPALGDTWAQVPATRIYLRWDTRANSKHCGQRVAYISKSCQLSLPYCAYYSITNDGIRGLKSSASSSASSHPSHHRSNASSSSSHTNSHHPSLSSSSYAGENKMGTVDAMDIVNEKNKR